MVIIKLVVKQKLKYKHPHGLKKFIILLAILISYMVFVMLKFGVEDGLAATALTWAFFVTCTPIADAGFIVDFPVRLVIGLKMIWSEVIVWGLALLIIAYGLAFKAELFSQLELLELFKTILKNPWPLWNIIIISAVGTFLSIYIGDQIYTMVQEKKHHHHIKKLQIQRLVFELFVFIIVLALYFIFLSLNGLSIG